MSLLVSLFDYLYDHAYCFGIDVIEHEDNDEASIKNWNPKRQAEALHNDRILIAIPLFIWTMSLLIMILYHTRLYEQ